MAIALGLAVLNGRLHAPQAAVTWVSLVVGVHFLALAVLWKLAFFHWLGAAIALCGAVGLVLAATLLELWRRAEDERVEVACLAVIDGVAATDAVQYVRQHYHRRAVETPWQRRYGSQFQP